MGGGSPADTRAMAAEVTSALPAEPRARRRLGGRQARQGAVALLRDRSQQDGEATAYVCENFVCSCR